MNKSIKNQALAILLSFLIIIAGGALWGLISYAGYFSVWVSALTSFLAIFVYSLFKKNMKIWTFLYVLIVSLIVNFFAFWLAITFKAANLRPDLSFEVIFNAVIELLITECLRDLILCVLFTLFGTVFGYTIVVFNRNKKEALDDYFKQTGKDPKTMTEKEKRVVIRDYFAKKKANKNLNKEVATLQDKTDMPVEKKTSTYEKVINEIVEITRLKKTLTKEELLVKVKAYKTNTLDKLTKEEKQTILQEAQKEFSDSEQEKARKILLKLM